MAISDQSKGLHVSSYEMRESSKKSDKPSTLDHQIIFDSHVGLKVSSIYSIAADNRSTWIWCDNRSQRTPYLSDHDSLSPLPLNTCMQTPPHTDDNDGESNPPFLPPPYESVMQDTGQSLFFTPLPPSASMTTTTSTLDPLTQIAYRQQHHDADGPGVQAYNPLLDDSPHPPPLPTTTIAPVSTTLLKTSNDANGGAYDYVPKGSALAPPPPLPLPPPSSTPHAQQQQQQQQVQAAATTAHTFSSLADGGSLSEPIGAMGTLGCQKYEISVGEPMRVGEGVNGHVAYK